MTDPTKVRLYANYGFTPGSGTDFSHGDEPAIASRLDTLAKDLKIRIYGISGYRTPSHSVAVGGSANDPHTQGAAADIGVNGETRESAGQLTDAQLASVGLYRPFPGAAEINHVQLLPAGQQQMNGGKTSTAGKIIKGAGDIVKGGADVVTGNPAGGVVSAGKGASEVASGTGLPGVSDAWKAELAAVWSAIQAPAQYAGLFVVLVLAGVGLAVFGLSRATGKSPQEAPS